MSGLPNNQSPLGAIVQGTVDRALSGKLGSGESVANALHNLPQDRLRAYLRSANLTPAQLAQLTPGGAGAGLLSFRQNMGVLKHQAQGLAQGGLHNVPGRVLRGAWRGTLGSGGYAAAGAGLRGRYLPMGARLGMATTLLPEASTAFKANDATGEGRSRTERVGGVLGGAVGNLLAGLPPSVSARLGLGGVGLQMAASMAGQTVGRAVGAGAGRLIDRGVSAVRGVNAGDATMQQSVPRQAGSNAV